MGLQPALLAGHIVLRRAIFVVGYHYLRGLLRVLAVFVNQIHQLLVFGDCARRGFDRRDYRVGVIGLVSTLCRRRSGVCNFIWLN